MNQPRILFKLCAVASSVLLASGFIAYSAGAFGWLRGDRPMPSKLISSPTVSEEMVSEPKSPETVNAPAALFGGSKTISVSPLVAPTVAKTPEPVAAEPAQSIMLGSKSPAVRPLISPPAPQQVASPNSDSNPEPDLRR